MVRKVFDGLSCHVGGRGEAVPLPPMGARASCRRGHLGTEEIMGNDESRAANR